MQQKPFKTSDEQIELLKERGMSFNNVNAAKEYLEDYTYYGVINGYSDLFWEEGHLNRYKEGVSFSELKALHHFDESLRRFLTPYILQVESIVKSHIVYQFCNARKPDGTYAHEPDGYLDANNFDPERRQKAQNLTYKLREVLNQGRNFHGPIKHYTDNYGFVPLWVLATQLSFGHVVTFYNVLMPSERNEVARRFGIREHELFSILRVLHDFRNTIAHSNRVYCFSTAHRVPRILAVEPIENRANTRFGSILYILKILLSNSDFKSVCNELSTLLKGLGHKLKRATILDVARKMGMPQSMRERYNIHLE